MRSAAILKSELGGRLDPETYLSLSEKSKTSLIDKFGTHILGDVIEDMYRYPTFYGFDFSKEGVPVIKGENISKLGVIDTNQPFDCVPQEIHKRFPKTHLKKGDLVFTVRGIIGKVGYYSGFRDEANISPNTIKISISSSNNSKFFWYYLNLETAQKMIERLTSGQVQKTITVSDIKNIPIPLLDRKTQDEIVIKMDHAFAEKQRLEQKADDLLTSINIHILDQLKIKLPKPETRMCLSVSSADLKGKRYDPMPYQPMRIDTLKAIQRSKYELRNLEDVADFQKTQESQNNGNLPYLGLENIESNTGLYVASKEEKQEFGTALHFYPGDVLFPKLRPYLNKVYLADMEGYCSTEFHVLKAGADILPEYLAAFLRSQAVVRQTSCLMTGNTLPRLQTDDVKTLSIPVPPKALQKEISKEVRTRVQSAMGMKAEALKQLSQAKSEVETILFGE